MTERLAFSGFPVCPASPRELVDIDAAKIHTSILETEQRLSGAHGEKYRSQQDRKLLAALGLGPPRPPPPPNPRPSPRPTSTVGARITLGWKLSQADTELMIADLKAAREQRLRDLQGAVHRPLIESPRKLMPHYYGASLHGNSATNTDPRVGGTKS